MPDLDKLFAEQHPAGQKPISSSDGDHEDIILSELSLAVASTEPTIPSSAHHCVIFSKTHLENDVETEERGNQIFSSRPHTFDINEGTHCASFNCEDSVRKEEAFLPRGVLTSTASDRSQNIDPEALFTAALNEGHTENGEGQFFEDFSEVNAEGIAPMLVENASTTPRFGVSYGKHIHQTNSGTANGSSLATVLENLPLPREDFDQNGVRSSSPTYDMESSNDDQANAIGHSRSAHSFGPGDCLSANYFAQQQRNTENRRTHARHSSYEVPTTTQNRPNGFLHGQNVSNCLNGILAPSGACFAPFGRTNSLSRTGTDASSFSSSFSISSLSYSDYSASLASINDANSGDLPHQLFHQQPHDENSSKRSSLDRRSLTSYCSSSSNDDPAHVGIGCGQRFNETGSKGATRGNDSTGTAGGLNKRLLPLSNILPRGLFSRKTLTITPNVNYSSNDASSGTSTNDNNTCGTNNSQSSSWKLPFRPSAALAATFGSALSLSLPVSSNHMGKNHFLHHNVNKELAADAPSTTALILQDRPATLPPKSAEEELKHRQLYEQMIEAAKKKEQREAKQRKKQQRLQLKQEEILSAAVKEWTSEILPKWEEVKNTKRVRELWGQGLPPCVRGKVWKLAVGNELNITEELFEICVNRAKERLRQFEEESLSNHLGSKTPPKSSSRSPTPPLDNTRKSSSSATCSMDESPVNREGTVELIHLDVARTFPVLGIFQKGGPYYDLLLNVLGAYACYRPDVGYVQGMSFLAAVLLLNMDAPDTFIVFANLMNRPCQLAFFRLRQVEMERYFLAYDRYFHECLPKLYSHFKQLDIRPNLYLIEWLYTLYAKSLPLEITCRIWDVFVRDGEEFLFRTAIGILHHYEDILLHADFDRCVQFLTHLPDNVHASDLFRSIDDATPSCSYGTIFSSSIRHSTCGGGNSEKKRFMYFFNEVGDVTRPSSTCVSGCSSPVCSGGPSDNRHKMPTVMFAYAVDNSSSSARNTSSLPSSRRESTVQKNASNEHEFDYRNGNIAKSYDGDLKSMVNEERSSVMESEKLSNELDDVEKQKRVTYHM